MPEKPRVVVGLSGGVDSAVCAAVLQEQGFDVYALYLRNVTGDGGASEELARATAGALGMTFSVTDVRAEMETCVVAPFRESYRCGRTPNPCVVCNPAVKFRALFREADRVGARFAATGHYARAENGGLYRGHPARDQSYMLYRLPQAWLDRVLFPIGMWDKPAVRAYAARLGLPVSGRKDSMDICFVSDGDYAAFLEEHAGRAPGETLPPEGNFMDAAGHVLGRHKGIHHYTIGQRRGLGIAAGGRLYVVALEADGNRIVLGGAEDLLMREFSVHEMHWLVEPEKDVFSCEVRPRHMKASYPCTVRVEGDGTAVISVETPVRRPAPGQSAVLYRGDRVLGGGFITG